jgi:uncharacterized membrane protein YuzA (DUF378 family)
MTQAVIAYLLVGFAGLWSIRKVVRAQALKLKPVRVKTQKPGACGDCDCG